MSREHGECLCESGGQCAYHAIGAGPAPRGAPGDPPEPVEPYGAVDLDEGCCACATTMRKYCPNCDTLYSQPVRPDVRTAVARQTGGTDRE